MSIQEIKLEIERMPPNEIDALSKWIADHQAKLWDDEIADDLDAGNLDAVLEEVDKEYRAGMARPL